jgi:hypothetical protein
VISVPTEQLLYLLYNTWHCAFSQVLAHARQRVALQPILMHMLSCILLDFVSMRQNALGKIRRGHCKTLQVIILSDTCFRHLHCTPVKSMCIFKVSFLLLQVQPFLACKPVACGLDCGVGCKSRRVSTWAVHVKHLSLPLVTPP